MTWRGIIARTDYVVADEGIVVVGVATMTDHSSPDSALDRLNAEITAVVACQQSAAFAELKCFAALTRNGTTFRVWQCDIVGTQLRISRHFFLGNEKSLRPQIVMPSSVVSFVIQQREYAETIVETTT